MQKVIGTILVGIAIAAAAFYPFSPDQKEQSSGPVSSLKPGSYRAEYDQPDFRGWKAFLIMEVNTAGEINNIQYDYISTAGVLKTQDAAYNQRMKSKNGLGPSQYCPRFAKNLQIYQDPAKVDGITGATQSYKNFKDLAQAAFDAAKAGSRTVMLVPQPEANAPQAAGGKK